MDFFYSWLLGVILASIVSGIIWGVTDPYREINWIALFAMIALWPITLLVLGSRMIAQGFHGR